MNEQTDRTQQIFLMIKQKECGDELIGDCYSEEDVIAMKDHQLKNVLEVLEKSVEEWDTEKCPAVMQVSMKMINFILSTFNFRAHVERVKGSEDHEDDEDNDGDYIIMTLNTSHVFIFHLFRNSR